MPRSHIAGVARRRWSSLIVVALMTVAPAGAASGAVIEPGDALALEGVGPYPSTISSVVAVSAEGQRRGAVTVGRLVIHDFHVTDRREIYVSTDNAIGRNSQLLRVDAQTGSLLTVATAPFNREFFGIGSAPDGTLVVTDWNTGHLYRMNPETGAQTLIGPTAGSAYSVRVGRDGTIYYSIYPDPDFTRIHRLDPVTGATGVVADVTNEFSSGFTLDHDGALLVVSNNALPNSTWVAGIVRVDPSTGTQTPLYTAPPSPQAFGFSEIAVDAAGDLIAMDRSYYGPYGGTLWRIDRETGQRTLIGSNFESAWHVDVFVPEPAAAGLCLFAVTAVLLRRRRA